MLATIKVAEAPWVCNPFGLVSLKEIVALMAGSDDFPNDRIIFGPLTNALYALGRLEGTSAGLSAKGVLEVSFTLKDAADSLEAWGFVATCGSFRNLAELIEDHVVQGRDPLHGAETIPTFVALARQTLMHELEARVFLPIEPGNARYYLEPLRDWEEVANRFPNAVEDIKEASKCYALARYAACIYHSMQVLEFGLLELGKLLGVNDPKSGFTAVTNALDRLLDKKWGELTETEQRNRAFLEQVNQPIQALKDACRNKVSHAEGRAVLLRADFSSQITMEIYMDVRAIMRRLATEMPKEGFTWNPFRR